ncbi:MAG: alanyl-tRNA editing protein [Hyphomicrobiales bacterium]|nr:alanyl-tRNA editing protein [Hyphomicrobiales bacterium]MCP5002095.1 alanyl-tRNA editing protein [Hyphomicrobiales bacterium]
MQETQQLFLDDAYLSTAEGSVTAINDRGGILLDQTCFYATSGGQPGDIGFFERQDGSKIEVAATVNGHSKAEVVHVPANGQSVPEIGETLALHIDWERRYKLMRMHTACHLLTVVCPFPITGASVGENESRIDFDMSETIDKVAVTGKLMELVTANHAVFSQWIDEAELEANPDLVKSKNVRPPRGSGRIRLVCIGDAGDVDSQPCGGTHVSETGEVGAIHIGKIEKKGRENRRFRIRFGELPG